jgi:hypothetical protein
MRFTMAEGVLWNMLQSFGLSKQALSNLYIRFTAASIYKFILTTVTISLTANR